MKRFKKTIASLLLAMTAALCLGLGAACDEEEFSYEGGGSSNAEYVQIYNLNPSNTPVQMSILDGRFVFRAPTRAGLVFEGLYDAAGLQIVDKNGNCLILVQNGLQLYARWSKMECTFYFNAGEDGAMDEEELTKTFEYESDLYSFPTPTPVAGKEFVCWLNGETPVTDENGDLLEGKDKLTGENFTFTENTKVYLTAQYKVQTFTYTFDYQDEDYENKSGTVEYGATFATIKTEFPELVDTGSRELVGWSTDAYSMVEVTDETAIAEDVTLYAIWREYKTFYFYEDVGVSATPVKIYQGDNEMYQPAQKNGYEFIGWYTNNYFGGNAVQSISYYSANELYWARWEMETYTLTFESNGGGSFAPVSYTIEDYKELPAPEKENFTFVGWCMQEDLSDTPRTVISVGSFGGGKMYAKYKGIDRTAKFQTNGGTLSQEQTTVEYGAKYTLAVPTYEGFAFAGWFDGDGDNAKKLTDSKGVSYEIWGYLDEETTLYAKYTKKYYVNIEYKDKDGLSTSVGATAQVEEYYVSGEPAKFTVTVEEGYFYGGIYNSNGACVTREKEYTFNMPAADCNFVVQVYPETYTLTFELSGGTMEDKAPVSVTYGENFTLPVPYKKAHIFKGWLYNDELCTNENGESLSNTQITENGKLTAKFEVNPAFENYTEITTADEFLKIAENPAGVYVLAKNIDLSGKTWTAVDFSGSLDGSGFKVSGLKTNLFNAVTGTVKNLKLDVNISVTNTGGCQQIGGFAKVANGNALIENITVYGSVNTEGNYDCGGVLGGTSSGSPIIRNCKNYATVTSVNNGNQTGGVIGALHVIGGDIYGCENYGTVSGKNAAGVCAWIKSAMTFKECINEGNVTGTELAGGIVACLGGKATINACGSYGTVKVNDAAGGKYVGQNNVSYVNLKPIYIKEASELAWLSNCIAQEVFVLKNDIDMSGISWTPFDFGATLDGAGHQIKNFSLSSTDASAGFFLTLSGTVKNLKFWNASVETTSETHGNVGVLAALVNGNGIVQKVEVVSGSVRGIVPNMGGIVGMLSGKGTMEGCKNYASVTSSAVTNGTGGTGGILGYIDGGVIRDCENFGVVSGQYCVGGVIGRTWIAGACPFNNLVNHATVTGSADCVGGVIGKWG
ncbi:MAG: InlB B-repeat-containing protein, partial [Clostridia bacterium]|nr:InlB B-repeat-containing protein [Clostridia bacterium]